MCQGRIALVLKVAGMTLLAGAAQAAPALLRTTGGQVYRGELTVTEDGFDLRLDTASDQKPVRFTLNNVAEVRIGSAALRPQWAADFDGNGLLGAYFPNTDLSGACRYRLDPNIDFDWGQCWPLPGLAADYFSVRWIGQLRVPVDGLYTFFLSSDDGARLWIDGRLLIDQWQRQQPTEHQADLELQAGKRHRLRVEFFDHTFSASVQLAWKGPNWPRSVIPQVCFYTPEKELPASCRPPGSDARPPDKPYPPHARGVWLRNGSFVSGPIRSIQKGTVYVEGFKPVVRIPLAAVARLHFRDLTAEMGSRGLEGAPGVVTSRADFVPGHVALLTQGEVIVHSVLWGRHKFVIPGQVAAVVLAPCQPWTSAFYIEARKETRLWVRRLHCVSGGVEVDDPALEGLRLTLDQLQRLVRLPGEADRDTLKRTALQSRQ